MSSPTRMTESRRPLLYDEEQEFTAFDDDELQAAAKLRRKRQRMGLSNAERQRKWRQRQKEKNVEEYRRKENERKRRAYKPHHLLNETELQEQRLKDRLKAKRNYYRQKQKKSNNEPSTSRMTRSSKRNRLIVNMTFKRQRILRKAEKTKYNTDTNSPTTENRDNMILPNTPHSKTKLMMRKAGLQIHSKNAVYKQLLFGNTLTESLKNSQKKYKSRQSKAQFLAQHVIRKYRCLNVFSRHFGTERKKARVMNS